MKILLNTSSRASWAEVYEQTRFMADDLNVIEREANVRFRYPQTVSWTQRVDVRNARLMLEGNVVAHPTHNMFSAKINGPFDASLAPFLDGKPRWVKWEGEPGHLAVLDKIIEVPRLAVGGPVRLSQDNIAAIRIAINDQSTDGASLKFGQDPGDRLRLWLPDQVNREVLTITPWNLPGIEQPTGTLSAVVGTPQTEPNQSN